MEVWIKLKRFLFIAVLISFNIYSQQLEESEELDLIYYNLEFNTLAYNDLKQRWVITDPQLVREIFNQFLIQNHLFKNRKRIPRSELLKISGDFDEYEFVIVIKKRYFDNEIESMYLLPFEDYIQSKYSDSYFDIIEGGKYIQSFIGNYLYTKLKDKTYFHSDLTPRKFYYRQGYYIDLNINVLNPKMLIWAITTSKSNKYLIFINGEWGYNNLIFPGWFSNTYKIGLELKYFENITNDPNNYNFNFSVMTDFETKFPIQTIANNFIKNFDHIQIDLSGRISNNYRSLFKNTYIHFFSLLGINKTSTLINHYNANEELFSIQHSFNIVFNQRDIFSFFSIGSFGLNVGYSFFKLQLLKYKNDNIFINGPYRNMNEITASFDISNNSGFANYKLNLGLVNSLYDKTLNGFVGLKFLISNNIGFELTYVRQLQNLDLILWRPSNMLVFTPIFRINY